MKVVAGGKELRWAESPPPTDGDTGSGDLLKNGHSPEGGGKVCGTDVRTLDVPCAVLGRCLNNF